MSDTPQPTSKFVGRLGNSFSEFGNDATTIQDDEVERKEPQTGKVVKPQAGKTVKGQKVQEQRPGTEGKTFYLPPELHRWLKAYAAFNDKSMSDIVVEELEALRKKHPIG
jgi:hypothetical protein